MEQQSFRPSKQFLVRGAIATGIVALLLIVQTDWFRALFNKPPLPKQTPETTVNDLLTKDSNGNGIADWEEKLWGLDPTALYTDGVPNKTLIEQKKLALGATGGNQEPENETDALARELMTIATALGQEGQSPETLEAIATKMAQSVEITVASNHYGLKDLQTVPTTKESLRSYYDTFTAITKKYDQNTSELSIIIQSLETGNASTLGLLPVIQSTYENYARALAGMKVPVGIQREHLEITNSIHAIGLSLGYLEEVGNNAVHAIAGIALYRINDERLRTSGESIVAYLVRYGILEP